MRVALIHDWLTGMRGGEKVLEALCERYPEADLFTLLHNRGSVSETIERHRIETSFVQYLPFSPTAVDVVLLTHGHLDHCGKLPVLTSAGYKGSIYCTPATAEVARIVLVDAAEIQLEDAQYLNRRTLAPGSWGPRGPRPPTSAR